MSVTRKIVQVSAVPMSETDTSVSCEAAYALCDDEGGRMWCPEPAPVPVLESTCSDGCDFSSDPQCVQCGHRVSEYVMSLEAEVESQTKLHDAAQAHAERIAERAGKVAYGVGLALSWLTRGSVREAVAALENAKKTAEGKE